jgi:hypothetical protein
MDEYQLGIFVAGLLYQIAQSRNEDYQELLRIAMQYKASGPEPRDWNEIDASNEPA